MHASDDQVPYCTGHTHGTSKTSRDRFLSCFPACYIHLSYQHQAQKDHAEGYTTLFASSYDLTDYI